MTRVLVLNGPNLNLLGLREPEIYGRDRLEDVIALCQRTGDALGFAVDDLQSNHEGVLIDRIHEARGQADAIIINPGAFTHYSYAIFDALNAFDGVVIEVHISNVHKRESFRHHSVISPRADGIIIGCGVEGYALAMRAIARKLGSTG